MFFKEKNQYRVFDGDSYVRYGTFYEKKRAKLKGEELKLSGDAEKYRVKRASDEGFALWIH